MTINFLSQNLAVGRFILTHSLFCLLRGETAAASFARQNSNENRASKKTTVCNVTKNYWARKLCSPDASQIDKYLIRPNQNTVGGGGLGLRSSCVQARA